MRTFIIAAVLLASLSQNQADGASIETPILKLSLSGQWEPRPELTRGAKDRFAFYEPASGGLLYIQKLDRLNPQTFVELVTNLSASESFWGEASHPRLARIMATEFFPLPESYNEANAPYIRDAMKGGRTDPVYVWDLKGVEGDAQLFYTSQLIPRVVAARVNGKLNVGEEYAPLRVTHAENATVPEGDAVLFDLETERVAVDRAIERFGMPEGIKGHHLRYSWVAYKPSGSSAGPGISVLVAAPGSFSLNSKLLLDALRQSGGPR
jgi:hypothetical protein